MPDEWEVRHQLNPVDAADCWADPNPDGFRAVSALVSN
jgi:hypothetical protein